MNPEEKNTIVIIPTYNNSNTLGKVLTEVLALGLPVTVVNDGSTDETAQLLSSFSEIHVISYPENKGKGFALNCGLSYATKEGYRYAITMDSDGQHFAKDILVFLDEIKRNPDSLLIGSRNLTSENMPGKNTFANKFSNFWFTIETGLKLNDTQSGFRLYPLQKLKGIRLVTSRYEYELEIMVRAAWRNIPVINIPVDVYYPPAEERISHFRPLYDFTRISILNSVLVIIALLWYWPWKFLRSLTRNNIEKFISEQIIHCPDTNVRISCAIGLGVFMGIFPVWGYQMIIAGILAHFLKLNKVITIIASNISIPPMIPFILFGSYAIGGWILNRPVILSIHELSLDTLADSLLQYLAGSILMATICSLLAGCICLTLLSVFRKSQQVTS